MVQENFDMHEHVHVRVLYVLISFWLVWQDLFIQSVHNLCLQAENLRDLLEVMYQILCLSSI